MATSESASKALAAGAATLLVANIAWVGLVSNQTLHLIAIRAYYFAPVAATLAASIFAPSKRFVIAGVTAISATVIAGIASLAFEAAGVHVDFSGLRGALWVAALSAPYCFAVSFLTALAYGRIRKRR